ncbi:putative dicer-like protein [Choanephora cucurbitarum]|nr:putative dicer-like protein [Choanephora cucurbitarum]
MTEIYLDPEFVDLTPEKATELNNTEKQKEQEEQTAAPILFPREYQYELLKKAISENVIAVLDTGAGKTLISVMLIKHMLAIEAQKAEADAKYKRKLIFFIVDRVPLVFQQANVIKSNCDARLKEICGDMNVDTWAKKTWRDIFEHSDICVLTAEIFKSTLQRGFLSLEEVCLIIFDECHHAVKGHPFNMIMYEFYHRWEVDKSLKPKIFGMTASPIYSSKTEVMLNITKLETNLDCRVFTAKNTLELQQSVRKPFELIREYSMRPIDDLPPPNNKYRTPLPQELKRVELRYPETNLAKAITNKIRGIGGFYQCQATADYISNNLGPWCSDRIWKVMLYGAHKHGLFTPTLYMPEQKLSQKDIMLMQEAYKLCPEEIPPPDIKDSTLFTPKAQALVDCLSHILDTDDKSEEFCGIIFVERRHTAVAIKILIEQIEELNMMFRCEVLYGHGTTTGGNLQMKYTVQNEVIAKFRKGKINLMIATNVAEEGLDIQACNYVIRFDITKTAIGYIQSRGRARKVGSRYIVMLNTDSEKEAKLIGQLKLSEIKMKEFCHKLPEDRNILIEQAASNDQRYNTEYIRTKTSTSYLAGAYEIVSTGALLTLSSSVSLVHHYCATLPADDFCNFKPIYEIWEIKTTDQLNKLDVHLQEEFNILLQENWYGKVTIPIHQELVSFDCIANNTDKAKAKASLKACIALHQAQLIDDHLVPTIYAQKMKLKEEKELDSDGREVGSRRRENYYPTILPSLWSRDEKEELERKEKKGPYYVSLLDISNNCNQFRPMCLVTKKPLPFIPNITLYNNDQALEVSFKSNSVSFQFFNEHYTNLFHEYTLACLRWINNKTFTCPDGDLPYYLVPVIRKIERDALNANFELYIDMNEIRTTIKNDSKQYLNLDSLSDYQDVIVKDTSDQHQRSYYIESIEKTMTPLSKPPRLANVSISNKRYTHQQQLREADFDTFLEYYKELEELKVSISDLEQPLIQVARLAKNETYSFTKKNNPSDRVVLWLVPELCQLLPISLSVYRTLHVIPYIMDFVDHFLLAYDAKKAIDLPKINDVLMFEAYKASSADTINNYQRLEFLGDSVLKFITSNHVYIKFPAGKEFELTENRGKLISNKALFKSAKELKLYWYIYSQRTSQRLWRPPGLVSDADSPEIKKQLEQQKLSDKTLADVIESTLGASFLSQGLDGAIYAARQLLVPLEDIRRWSDFNAAYRKPHSNYDPTLLEVNVERVSHILGYTFADPSLLVEALTHASMIGSSVPSYQRLEFLGDAVLDFCVTKYLYDKYSTSPPGVLHNLRKSSVNNDILSVLCVQLKLHHHIRHLSDRLINATKDFEQMLDAAKEEGSDHDEYWLDGNAPKVLADVVESMIGAIYVDSGFKLDPIYSFFEATLKPLLDKHISIQSSEAHPLTQFVHLIQGLGCIDYDIVNIVQKQVGPNAQKCVIFIHSTAFSSGSGYNVNEARKQAAQRAIDRLKNDASFLSNTCCCQEKECQLNQETQ